MQSGGFELTKLTYTRLEDNLIGLRLALELQCSYQGQQGDVSQSVRGNYKLVFEGDKI